MARKMGVRHVVPAPSDDREFGRIVGTPWKVPLGYGPHYPQGFDVVVVTAAGGAALSDASRWVAAEGQL
jgi:hypothetical protein